MIQRALEVIRLTGSKMSELQAAGGREPLPYRVLKIVVCPESRAELHRRIRQRFGNMLEQGFEEEVRMLHGDPRLHAGLPAMRAVGYRQAWAWLDGHLGEDEWQEKAIAATRQLAKRQLTWLRKERGAMWYDSHSDGAIKRVIREAGEFLETGGTGPTQSEPHEAE